MCSHPRLANARAAAVLPAYSGSDGLLAVKLVAKLIGVWPVATIFKLPRRERTYTTLLMATGLTFEEEALGSEDLSIIHRRDGRASLRE